MTENLRLGLAAGENVISSVLVMFLLMAVGFVLAKKKVLTTVGIKQMTEMVLMTAVPSLVIHSYQREFDIVMVKKLCIAFLFAIIFHFISFALAPLIFRPREDKKDRVSVFSVIYSNCGFMALPLIESIYGSDGVFYAVAYVTVFNIFYWTQGVYVYTKDWKQLSFKKAFFTPGVIGAVIGLSLFALRIKLPTPLASTVSFVASLNTPVPMIILGTYLVNINIKKTAKNLQLWLVCLVRLILFPVIGILLAKVMQLPDVVAMPLVVACSCPAAAVATLFAARYNLDSEYASETVSVSTLLSIITIPIMVIAAVIIL